jgi:hypothetical protein
MSLWNKTDAQVSKPKYLGLGQVTTINLGGTMTGYTSGSFTIGAPPGGGVQAVATYTAAGGVITSYTITNPGAGYTTPPTVTAAGGSGGTFESVLKPIAKVAGPNTSIIFVDQEEAQIASNRAKGIKLPGWNKFTEYSDNQGAPRYKVECLIAMNVLTATSGDAADDTIVGDVQFAITTQPTASTVTAPAATSFTVAATGSGAFQWQVKAAAGGAYTNVTNGGVYTTATTATLNISNTTGLNGNRYRCVVANAATTASATSTGALLTVN